MYTRSLTCPALRPPSLSLSLWLQDMLELQVRAKERVKELLSDTSKLPLELIILGRTMNILRGVNKQVRHNSWLLLLLLLLLLPPLLLLLLLLLLSRLVCHQHAHVPCMRRSVTSSSSSCDPGGITCESHQHFCPGASPQQRKQHYSIAYYTF